MQFAHHQVGCFVVAQLAGLGFDVDDYPQSAPKAVF